VALLPDQLVKEHVPAVSEDLVHGRVRVCCSIILLQASCLGCLLLLSAVLFPELSLSLLFSFTVLEGLVGLLLGQDLTLLVFFQIGLILGGRCLREWFRRDGLTMKLPSIIRLILLAVLVLLAVLQESYAIALTELANDQLELPAEFNLNPTQLVVCFDR
jgi:hypothetical protein